MKFYKIDEQVVISCDKELSVGTELTANTTDGAYEKHVPVIEISGDVAKIFVGSVEHPSLPAHYIEFIVLETSTGIHTKWLKPGDKLQAVFTLNEEETPVDAFEFCNLHELWKASV